MKHPNPDARRLWLGIAGLILWAGLTACDKKTDPAATTSRGGASTSRHIMTLKGAPN